MSATLQQVVAKTAPLSSIRKRMSAPGRKRTNASSLSHAGGLIGTAGEIGDTDNGVSPTLHSMDDYGQPPGMAARRAAQAWPRCLSAPGAKPRKMVALRPLKCPHVRRTKPWLRAVRLSCGYIQWGPCSRRASNTLAHERRGCQVKCIDTYATSAFGRIHVRSRTSGPPLQRRLRS